MSQPYDGIRVIELSKTLAGRLAGLLFADQGAEVPGSTQSAPHRVVELTVHRLMLPKCQFLACVSRILETVSPGGSAAPR